MSERLAPDVSNYLAKEQSIRENKGSIPEKLALPQKENLPKELVAVAEAIGNISGTWNPV